jgi:hypothetical protein
LDTVVSVLEELRWGVEDAGAPAERFEERREALLRALRGVRGV